MIKPYTKNMTDKQKQDLLIQTFGRLKADPEDEDFQDVIIELAQPLWLRPFPVL